MRVFAMNGSNKNLKSVRQYRHYATFATRRACAPPSQRPNSMNLRRGLFVSRHAPDAGGFEIAAQVFGLARGQQPQAKRQQGLVISSSSSS
jgi:hypothetical protein